MKTKKTKAATAFDRLVNRCDRDAYWAKEHHEYVLPMGAVPLPCGNAAAPGVQATILCRRYPKRFPAAAKAARR
jgi:hypothetical protein